MFIGGRNFLPINLFVEHTLHYRDSRFISNLQRLGSGIRGGGGCLEILSQIYFLYYQTLAPIFQKVQQHLLERNFMFYEGNKNI